MVVMEFLNYGFLDNPLRSWLIAAAVVLVTTLVLRLLQSVAITYLDRLAQRTQTLLDDALVALLRQTKLLFLLLLGVFFASKPLQLGSHVHDILNTTVMVALLIQAGIWLNAVVVFSVQHYRQRRLAKDPAGVTTLVALGFVGRVVLWTIVLLLVLDNLGVDVTALIAGLGVGGIAVALAVQNILGDLFASLSIVLDKPFTVGDFLIIDDFLGSVEGIGLKTTRIRSLSGEQLIFSNADLLGSRIRNYGRMYERRVLFNIGVTYQTPRDKLRRIPAIIRDAIESQQHTRFDRSHFKEYGSFSLNFETVYYVIGPDYNTYMDIQQAINFAIHEQFEQLQIEFAYPTQTILVHSE